MYTMDLATCSLLLAFTAYRVAVNTHNKPTVTHLGVKHQGGDTVMPILSYPYLHTHTVIPIPSTKDDTRCQGGDTGRVVSGHLLEGVGQDTSQTCTLSHMEL